MGASQSVLSPALQAIVESTEVRREFVQILPKNKLIEAVPLYFPLHILALSLPVTYSSQTWRY